MGVKKIGLKGEVSQKYCFVDQSPPPPPPHIFLNFMHFFWKISQKCMLVSPGGLAPLLLGILDPPLTTTGISEMEVALTN